MAKVKATILIIDDDEDVLLTAKMLLKRHIKEVVIEKDPRKIPFLLNNDTFDVILLDMNFSQDTTSGKEGFYWLEQILEKDPGNAEALLLRGDSYFRIGMYDVAIKSWETLKQIMALPETRNSNKPF